MRKLSILFLCCLFSLSSAWGQASYTFRYWFDDDVDAIQESTLPTDMTVNLPVDGLTGWFHLLHFQVHEEGGLWSSVRTRSFVLVPEGNRFAGGQYRYWFDDQEAASVEGSMTSNVVPLDIPVDELTGWLHLLHFQVRDNDGLWSSVRTRSFALVPEGDRFTNGQYRYWFDERMEDAVAGSMTKKVVPLDIPVDELTGWLHLLHFQVRDQKGLWSSTSTRPFALVPEGDRFTEGQYRYWFDDDMAAAVTDNVTSKVVPLDIPVDSLTGWFHLLHFQVRDQKGLWSSTSTRSFALVPEGDRFTEGQYRYWFDDDMEAAVTDSVTSKVVPLDIPVDKLTGWFHLLHFQVRDQKGLWSSTSTRSFAMVPEGDRFSEGQYSYWFDGNKANAVTGTITSKVIPLDIPVDELTGWFHLLHFQVCDNDGLWSSVSTRSFAIAPDVNGGTYRYWFDDDMSSAVAGELTASSFELEFPVHQLAEGEHVLNMRIKNQEGQWSPIATCSFFLSSSSLTVMSDEGGTVGVGEDLIREDARDYNFLNGTQVQLTITPDEGYAVDSIIVNGSENVTSQLKDSLLAVEVGAVSSVVVTYELVDFMKLGDVNNDKRVSAADIALTVDYLIGGTPSPFIRRQADANSDGEINVGDLTRIVDFITGAVPRGIKRKEKREEEKNEIKDRSYHDVLTGCLTGKGMEIAMQNEAEYTAFQMALTLPEGVEAEDVRISAVRRHDHVVASGRLDDGRLNVVVYSGKNRPLHGNEGPLLEVSFGDGAAEVDHVQVDDIVFVTKAGEVCKFAPLTISGADGIERLSTDSFREGKGEAGMVYDLGGRRMPDGKVVKNKLPHGVYIVNGKKIIFK